MGNRIVCKPTEGEVLPDAPMQILANSEGLESRTLAIYLFTKPGSKKLFITNSPLNLEKLIGNLKRQTTIA